MPQAALHDDTRRSHQAASLPRIVSCGLIGSGIQASGSPKMHESEGARQELALSYRLLDLDLIAGGVEAVPRILEAAEWFGLAGVNVTHPCKQAIIPYLDELAPSAAAVGAVNTVIFAEGRRIGHNTDLYGFRESFRRDLGGATLGRVLQLGAGGAGYAVAHAVKELGAGELLVFDPDLDKAEALVSAIVQRFGPGAAVLAGNAEEVAGGCDGIVNASPVGMAKYPGMPIEAASLRPRHWLADIIYFPRETELLAKARAIGCRVMAGDGMAAYQAAEAFRLFTGLTPDAEAMRRTLDGTNGIA